MNHLSILHLALSLELLPQIVDAVRMNHEYRQEVHKDIFVVRVIPFGSRPTLYLQKICKKIDKGCSYLYELLNRDIKVETPE